MDTSQENVIQGPAMFQGIASLSFEGLWHWNILTNEYLWGDGFRELTGKSDWRDCIHPLDRKTVQKRLQVALDSSVTHWDGIFRLVWTDGSTVEISSTALIHRDKNGKAYGMTGIMIDRNKQRLMEEKMEQEMGLKEKRVEDARDTERLNMGKELHDNVNQLLGASKLYLDMAKRGGKKLDLYLNRSSEYILTAIGEIRNLTKGVTTDIIKNIGLCEAISNVVRDTREVNPVAISFNADGFTEDSLDDSSRLNIFRIVQEQLNNILKHAQATKVVITISKNEKSITLIISDNGVGFDTGKVQRGMGLANIKSRAAACNGSATFVSQPGKGCVVTVKFPAT